MLAFAEDIQRFAESVVGLQDERHAADYDPAWTRFESQVTDWINETREVIGRFERTHPGRPSRLRRSRALQTPQLAAPYPYILLNSLSTDTNASAYITAPSRNGAPGSSIGALGDVK